MTSRVAIALALVAWVGVGCATRSLVTAPGDAVHLGVEPQEYSVIAAVQGKDCVPTYLSFIQFSNPDLLKAEIKAMQAAPGSEILLNKHVYVQKEVIIPILTGNSCFYVEGLAVNLR